MRHIMATGGYSDVELGLVLALGFSDNLIGATALE